MQRRRLVAVQAQPRLRPFARRGGRLLGERERLDRPLVRLLVALRPRVGHHAVGRRVEPGDGPVVGQQRAQMRLRGRREHDDGGLVLPQIVEEELAQALAIERGARRAALVELVNDAPDGGAAVVGAVGEAEVRIAQAVLAQVLPGAREDDDARAALGQARRRVLGELHRARHREGARRPLLAAAPRLCGTGREQQEGERGAGAACAHRVILSS